MKKAIVIGRYGFIERYMVEHLVNFRIQAIINNLFWNPKVNLLNYKKEKR